MSETQKKPLGLVLVALYSVVTGLVSVPVGCTGAFLSGVPGAPASITILSVLVMTYGTLLLAVAYGLWTFQPWGRDFAWWVYIVAIPLGLLLMLPVFQPKTMSLGNVLFQLVAIGVNVAVVLYLARPEIVSMFRGEPRPGSFDEFVRREPK